MSGALTGVYGVMALAQLFIALLLVIRLLKGPTLADRVVALNAMSTQATVCLFYVAAFAHRSLYLDTALWMASFSFLGTLVWARLLERELL